MKLLCFLFLLTAQLVAQTSYNLRSPNGNIDVRIRIAERVRYDVALRGNLLLRDTTMSLTANGETLGLQPRVRSNKPSRHDQTIEPVVRQKFAKLRDNYNELRLEFDGNYAIVFRAYDYGVAYRFETSLPQNEVTINNEEALFNFPSDYKVFYPAEESLYSHNERLYTPTQMHDIGPRALATLPAVVNAESDIKVAIAESDIDDYPGMWLRGTDGPALAATFPPYPLKLKPAGDRDVKVLEAADYIAKTKGRRTFPWRAIGIAEHDADLITNPLLYLLQKPTELTDTSWIRPGKVAWDWWNANNIDGVDFKSGINTQTYKYYIDFASQYGIPYIILDEGWYKLGNVLDVVPDINIPELVAYGRQKNVGLILWVTWKSLDEQFLPALDQYEKWGIKGVKVDFMQRDDQPMIEFLQRVCLETAKRHMLVDFHGVQRSAIMTRTWPNLISNEGVRGNEWNKWGAEITPTHTVTLPFTRMFLGPMDFTPGAVLNANKKSFAAIFERPMSQGTRCRQLAMYVVYESPLQMLADSPSNYFREPDAMQFLSAVPTVWDDSIPLAGKIAEYVVIARRSGNDWYIGAMTDWTPRDISIDLSFLPAGQFTLAAYEDGINADRMASDYKMTKNDVDRTAKLTLKLASGGGWAARITPRQ
jgi:alpha-glucosidase